MKFYKAGTDVQEALRRTLGRLEIELSESKAEFERSKAKQALVRMEEIDIEMDRLRCFARNVDPLREYQLTEKDLIDFGF